MALIRMARTLHMEIPMQRPAATRETEAPMVVAVEAEGASIRHTTAIAESPEKVVRVTAAEMVSEGGGPTTTIALVRIIKTVGKVTEERLQAAAIRRARIRTTARGLGRHRQAVAITDPLDRLLHILVMVLPRWIPTGDRPAITTIPLPTPGTIRIEQDGGRRHSARFACFAASVGTSSLLC